MPTFADTGTFFGLLLLFIGSILQVWAARLRSSEEGPLSFSKRVKADRIELATAGVLIVGAGYCLLAFLAALFPGQAAPIEEFIARLWPL